MCGVAAVMLLIFWKYFKQIWLCFFFNLFLDMLLVFSCANLLFFLRAELGRAYPSHETKFSGAKQDTGKKTISLFS